MSDEVELKMRFHPRVMLFFPETFTDEHFRHYMTTKDIAVEVCPGLQAPDAILIESAGDDVWLTPTEAGELGRLLLDAASYMERRDDQEHR